MRIKFVVSAVLALALYVSCGTTKKSSSELNNEKVIGEVSKITNKAPYNPWPGMQKQKTKNGIVETKGNLKSGKTIHFLVFGDSKGSPHLQDVLKRADSLEPQFCLTTADFVNKGAGLIGEELYKKLDADAGWFFRKYPTWPTLGNHEVYGSEENSKEENYISGVANFGDFFGLKEPYYSFSYGNAKFIALDWVKVSESQERMDWLQKELQEAQGKLIFVFKHRPYYTVGSKNYLDVEGKPTEVTELFTKYKVTAVFSGHDHLYYRTIRDNVVYMVSAGAGANIYPLKRQGDAIAGDSYYGRTVENQNEFLYHSKDGKETKFNEAMYFLVSVKIKTDKVVFEMIDAEGKVWDNFSFPYNF